MAQRRMFSPQIVGSDAFLEMPTSSRELYFQLGMYADDDGFISPRKIMRMVGANDDDLKVLIGKRFVLPFESGVVVIKHWMINNLIRRDWYRETQYTEEKSILRVKGNKSYTLDPNQGNSLTSREQTNNESATEVRLGKVRLGKVTNTTPMGGRLSKEENKEIGKFIDLFKLITPTYRRLFQMNPQRQAADRLLKIKTLEQWTPFMEAFAQKMGSDPYCPKATTPSQLEAKLGAIIAYGKTLKVKEGAEGKGRGFA